MLEKDGKYLPSFKAKVALEAVKGQKSIHELSVEYNISTDLVMHWKKNLNDKAEKIFKPFGSEQENFMRINAESDLQQNKERLRTLIEHSPVAICTFYKDGLVKSWNEAAEIMTGWKEEEVINRPSPVVPDEKKEEHLNILQLVSSGTPLMNLELQRLKKDGSPFYINLSARALLDSNNDVIEILTTAIDITEQKKATELSRKSLKEKEILLSEIHHRVKNNLAVISSLLVLQAEYITDDSLKSIFEQSISRIQSMALIHEILYQSESFAYINFEEYLNKMLPPIIGSFSMFGIGVDIQAEAKDITLDVQTAISCGMIINELISNSHKHAFKGREYGKIKIALTRTGHQYMLKVSDDGIGLPHDFSLENRNSLGLVIVKELTDQIGGDLIVNRNKGTEITISFLLDR